MLAARRYARCPHCGAPAQAIPYFSRGVNVGKAVALMLPFSFVGPVLFFLFRKDRVICSVCMRLLVGERAMPMLDVFSAGGAGGLPTAAAAGALMNVMEGEREIAVLDARQRRVRARATAFGVVSGGFVALAIAAGLDGSGGASFGFFMFGLPVFLGTVWSVIKSRALRRDLVSRRQRHRALSILSLARAHGGRLNVTLVAAELSLDLQEAERLLDSLVDGHRVDMQVDDSGRVTYVFSELIG